MTFRSGARVCAIYGGADAIPQLRKFAGGIEIVVCRLVGSLTDRWFVVWVGLLVRVAIVNRWFGFGWVEKWWCWLVVVGFGW